MTPKSIFDRIRNYDAYPKTLEDFQVKTYGGATVTFVSTILMILLFISELHDYLTPSIEEDLFVDTTREIKLRINLDIVFPNVPCSLLSLDAMDTSGEQHMDIQHNIYHRRLHPGGQPIEEPEKQEVIGHSTVATSSANTSSTEASKVESCGSCYGAEFGERKCCNSCEEVKEAYRKKGWGLPDLKKIDQCIKEGKTDGTPEKIPEEGCQIYGYLVVNRVGGNFHIAPGKSFQHSHLHVHDVQQYRTTDFDLSHKVRHLSFGTNVAGKTNPIDGLEYNTEKGARNINYYLKIVPTAFHKLDGSAITTNQFSVTQHEKAIQFGTGEGGLPGVFFTYELSPMMVKYTQVQKSLGHFLTGVCAIIGGIFTVASLIDSAIYHSVKSIQKKIELGKAS